MKAALFALGLSVGLVCSASARVVHFSTDTFVRKIEIAMQISPGSVKIDPRFGLSVEYLGTKSLPDSVYAVYLKKLD